MNNESPLISVCIPAFNRPEFIGDLLETIVTQSFNNFEVVICEDNSPRTLEVEKAVQKYVDTCSSINIRFIRNKETLGYDGNFRKLIEVSRGRYCVFMGDDDLMCENALSRISEVINDNSPGVILRSWATANRETKKIREVFRYFDGDRLFKSGEDSIVTLFRRSVAIAGHTIERKTALKYATDQFDGTLLYQLYLTGMILSETHGYYIADLIAIMRKNSDQSPSHFFGTAKAEKDRFVPGKLENIHSLNFIDGMIDIAFFLETRLKKPGLYKRILKDMSVYSYPLLSVQSHLSIREFSLYYSSLFKKGLWRSFYFHLYFIGLIIFGKNICARIIVSIKKYLNRTPILGSINSGEKV